MVNPAYGQYALPNGVFVSASPDATDISSISVRDAVHPPTMPLPIAGGNSFYQTERPLFDSPAGSHTPDGMIAHNGRNGFANCFTLREAQPVYHFSESGPSPFDVSFIHQTTAGTPNLWLDGHDLRSVTGHQDAQTLDTLGSGHEFSVGDLS